MKSNYFKCDYCYTFVVDKTLMTMHERECLYNPQNKHCNSCTHRKLIKNKNDESLEYICAKGYKIFIKENIVPCNKSLWKLASPNQLKIRSQKKEWEK